jgi:molybdopterin adenylyltransferase
MSSSTTDGLQAAVLTVSDSCSRGERTDRSGPALVEALKKHQFQVVGTAIVSDDRPAIEKALVRLCGEARLVLTTGGTGLGPRDFTPEATLAVTDRRVEGLPERIRLEGSRKTPYAVLSRGVCGTRGESLILNLPGSPQGAVESLEAIVELLPHALQVLAGNTVHP